MKRLCISGLLFLAMVQVHQPDTAAQPFELTAVMASGGGRIEVGGYEQSAVIGQPSPALEVRRDSLILSSGFLYLLNLVSQSLAIQPISAVDDTVLADLPLPVEVGIFPRDGVTEVILAYRQGGAPTFATVPMALGTEAEGYEALIPEDVLTARGLEYQVRATDLEGNVVTRSFYRQVRVSEVSKEEPQPFGATPAAYRLVSVPIDLANPDPAAVFSELGPYDPFTWRFYRLLPDYLAVLSNDSTATPYREYDPDNPAPYALDPGRAFWLIVAEPGFTIDGGPGVSTPLDQPYQIPLHQGWNFIGLPFAFEIPVEKLSLQSQGAGDTLEIRAFTGETGWGNPEENPVTVLRPFEGYAVYTETVNDVLLVDPDLSLDPTGGAGKQGGERVASVLHGMEWAVRIRATSDHGMDVDNLVGVSGTAGETWDARDRPEPLDGIGAGLSVYFPRPAWNRVVTRFRSDVRAPFTEGQAWTFEVASSHDDPVSLSFDGLEQVPEAFGVWVLDEALNVYQDLRTAGEYQLAAVQPGVPRRLTLIVGETWFGQTRLDDAQTVPSDYTLEQNYPNPFNPTTTIGYRLPVESLVTLTVHDVLGKEVSRLVDQQVQGPGYHEVRWDGASPGRGTVASGVYLYRLIAGDRVLVKTMSLIK